MAKAVSMFFLGLVLGAFIGGLIVFVVSLALGKITLGENLQATTSTAAGSVGASTLPTSIITLPTITSPTINITVSTSAEPTISITVPTSTKTDPVTFETVPTSTTTEHKSTTIELSSTSTLFTTEELNITITQSTLTTEVESTTSNVELSSTKIEPSITATMPTSTTTESPSTTAVRTTTTSVPTSTSADPTSTSPSPLVTTVVPSANLACLIVGDMSSFGTNQTAYDQEKYCIGNTSQSIFNASPRFRAGLSLYGFVSDTRLKDEIANFTSSFEEFRPLLSRMKYTPYGSKKSATMALNAINQYKDFKKNHVNCLIFFSAQLNPAGLPLLKPKMEPNATLVAVGFNGVNLERIVKGRGKAVSVPNAFTAEHVRSVVEAVLAD